MSLKIRLTFVQMSILGGILMLSNIVVYASSSVILISQVDRTLERNAADVINVTRASTEGGVETIAELSLGFNVFMQVWARDGSLKGASANLRGFSQSLDRVALQTSEPVFRDVILDGIHLRVLTVPLIVEGRPFGVLQVANNMAIVDGARQDLLTALIVVSIFAMGFAGVLDWISIQNTLNPLEGVTAAALQITETNDLSRRIPLLGPPNDEVGNLVQAFNLNLSQLEQLIESQRRFLADVGHELRTPLTVIKGNVDLMRRIGEMDEESLVSIEDEVERLTRLVGDLLLLAQAEAGKLPLEQNTVELDTVLLEVYRQAKVLAKDQIALKIEEIDQVLICGDRDRLKQVLLNLISNGIKYTPPGGQVAISLSKAEGKAYLSVADNGPGIPEEDLPHIFERFYRAEKSRLRSRDGKGFGLGLSIAYWIIHNHQGDIEVTSRQGEGTTFKVILPLEQDLSSGLSESI